ncbi:glycosyl transferase [Podochytrium sp. JEL0797]|nr:glycosyl transferase [Podochytrium sp. JEL0797]
MLKVEALGYASEATVLFQRATVMGTEGVLFGAVASIFADVKDARTKTLLTALVFLSPGLLFVDHIHFQYNGFLYGIQVLSIHAMWKERFVLGGVLFAVTMNFKHIYLYQAPAYFVYLLSQYCFIERLKMAGKEVPHVESLTRGLVGNSAFGVLPEVVPLHTLVLTVVFQLPSLWKLWKRPTKLAFVDALVLCGFSSFLFGWHVHEKAILLVLIPLSLVATRTRRHAQVFYVLSWAGSVSLVQLIFKATETPTKVIVFLLYAFLSAHFLGYLTQDESKSNETAQPVGLGLGLLETLYVYGLAIVYVYSEFVHEIVFSGRLEFLPLMVVSVYCAVGVVYSFVALSVL